MKNEKQNVINEEYDEVSNDFKIWKPQIADVLIGKIVKRQKSSYGNSFVIEKDDELFLLPNHQVLESLLERCHIGDNVRVVCTGTQPNTKGKNPTMLYKVFIKKENQFLIIYFPLFIFIFSNIKQSKLYHCNHNVY